LHCTTNGDRGGNCVPLTYFKSRPKPNTETNNDADDYAPNLHGIWDKEIFEKSMQARGFTTAQAYAAALDAAFQSEFPAWQSDGIHIADWAIDSHQHAEDISYGDLPKLIAIDKHPRATVFGQSPDRQSHTSQTPHRRSALS
jgi:S1/P1 nuclease